MGSSSGVISDSPKRQARARMRKPAFHTIPTLYDVCRLPGVSSATVSRVFSGNTPVSERTRTRVMAAASRIGYVPSHAGRALRSRRTQTIGAIFPEMSRHFYPDVLTGIDEGAAEVGFDVLASGRSGSVSARSQ
jgi:LacI family transcriptional regulator